MKIFPKLYLNCRFEIVEIADETMAVSVGNNENGYNGTVLLKNESTRFMFEKLQEGITFPELIKACMDKYTDSPVEEVGPQVKAFLDKMQEQGLLVADVKNGLRVPDR